MEYIQIGGVVLVDDVCLLGQVLSVPSEVRLLYRLHQVARAFLRLVLLLLTLSADRALVWNAELRVLQHLNAEWVFFLAIDLLQLALDEEDERLSQHLLLAIFDEHVAQVPNVAYKLPS